jgi:hypothetical protein
LGYNSHCDVLGHIRSGRLLDKSVLLGGPRGNCKHRGSKFGLGRKNSGAHDFHRGHNGGWLFGVARMVREKRGGENI